MEGSTENTTVVCGLLVGLRERGLDTTRSVLVVIDGAKALAKAVREVLPACDPTLPAPPDPQRAGSAARAAARPGRLEELAKELAKAHPGAAGSLREALPETLTILRLDVPPTWSAPCARRTRPNR